VGDGALRVVLDASGARVAPRPLPPATAPTVLRPWVLPGGLGEHKWADRRLVDALGADGTTPLLVDLDGAVLEAGYAAVLLRRDGVLLGPPVDGRILPSTTRARHDVRPARLTLADLTGGEVLLASALRGLHPARLATRA
jgi:para-aminobenzoate synthetase/4-amino-4-deoxychorismate lyase